MRMSLLLHVFYNSADGFYTPLIFEERDPLKVENLRVHVNIHGYYSTDVCAYFHKTRHGMNLRPINDKQCLLFVRQFNAVAGAYSITLGCSDILSRFHRTRNIDKCFILILHVLPSYFCLAASGTLQIDE